MSTPDELQDDFDRGVRNRRAMLGDAWVDQSLDRASEFNADFQHLITRYAWHDIWGRPGLPAPTRRLLVLGMTMGLARWEEFELHCRAAIRGGVPIEQIKETLMQGAIYCGVPAANTAFKITTAILREEGLLPPPAPLTSGVRPSSHHTFSRPQLHVRVQGVAREGAVPVVLSHALGVDLQMWDVLAAHLASPEGGSHLVLRHDHRGHGGSAVPPGPYTMDELVSDAARVIREWGCAPVVFVGLSLGGMVGQGLAIHHPELLRGLVLANTTACQPPAAHATWAQRIGAVQAGGMAALADGVIERWLGADFRAAQPGPTARLRDQLLRCDPAGYMATAQAVAAVDWLERLPQVGCPTLVIAGGRDTGTPPEMAQAIAEAVPNARLELLPEAAHMSVVEAPERFATLVREFIATL
jgi:3-oxoadipate enol-lactonase